MKAISEGRLIGSVDLFSDSTDLREAVELRGRIAGLYAKLGLTWRQLGRAL